MKVIDCNTNKELASELTKLLEEYSAVQEDDRVYVTKDISADTIELFLKETGRSQHRAFSVESDRFVIAIPQDLQDIGLDSCEFCGYVSYKDDVDVHRRSHQAL